MANIKRVFELPKIFYTFGKIFFMIERLSTIQYGKKAGMSKQLILYYIAQNKPLDGVLRVEKIAGRNILHTDLTKLRKNVNKKVA